MFPEIFSAVVLCTALSLLLLQVLNFKKTASEPPVMTLTAVNHAGTRGMGLAMKLEFVQPKIVLETNSLHNHVLKNWSTHP